MLVKLAAGASSVDIDPGAGGRLSSLRADGLELLLGRDEAEESGMDVPAPFRWGCFVMAPYAGRVRHGCVTFGGRTFQLPLDLPPHGAHGTVVHQPWRVEHAGATDAVLVSRLGDPWPWQGRVVHRVRLREHGLQLRLEVWAEDDEFPASAGWHPWWRRRLERGGTVEIELDARAAWQRDAEGIPTGDLVAPPAGPWDDCFTELAAPPVLRWPGALELTVASTCLDVVVFDELAPGVCVEPQSGPPDALRLAPVVVEPGLPLIAEATFSWRTLPAGPAT